MKIKIKKVPRQPNIEAYGGFLDAADNLFAIGGDVQMHGGDYSNGAIHINEGNSHEENPYDGVQVGVDPEGTPNLVEEGEVIFNDYVYSNRILCDDETKEKFHISKKREISFADLAKKLEKESSERPNDPISKAALKVQMESLAEEQERQKAEMQAEEAREAFEALSPEEQVAVMQQAEAQQVDAQAQQEAVMQEQAMAEQQAAMQQQGMPMGIDAAMQGQMMPQGVVPEGGMMQAYGGPINQYGLGGNLFVAGGDKSDLAKRVEESRGRSILGDNLFTKFMRGTASLLSDPIDYFLGDEIKALFDRLGSMAEPQLEKFFSTDVGQRVAQVITKIDDANSRLPKNQEAGVQRWARSTGRMAKPINRVVVQTAKRAVQQAKTAARVQQKPTPQYNPQGAVGGRRIRPTNQKPDLTHPATGRGISHDRTPQDWIGEASSNTWKSIKEATKGAANKIGDAASNHATAIGVGLGVGAGIGTIASLSNGESDVPMQVYYPETDKQQDASGQSRMDKALGKFRKALIDYVDAHNSLTDEEKTLVFGYLWNKYSDTKNQKGFTKQGLHDSYNKALKDLGITEKIKQKVQEETRKDTVVSAKSTSVSAPIDTTKAGKEKTEKVVKRSIELGKTIKEALQSVYGKDFKLKHGTSSQYNKLVQQVSKGEIDPKNFILSVGDIVAPNSISKDAPVYDVFHNPQSGSTEGTKANSSGDSAVNAVSEVLKEIDASPVDDSVDTNTDTSAETPIVEQEVPKRDWIPYSYYTNGSDGIGEPWGFTVDENGEVKEYTDEYKRLVNSLGADSIRQWAKEHPDDPSLISFLEKGNKLENLTDEMWRKGAMDGKYGFMHHVADKILQDAVTPEETPAVEESIENPSQEVHMVIGDYDQLGADQSKWVGVGPEAYRENRDGVTYVYHNPADSANEIQQKEANKTIIEPKKKGKSPYIEYIPRYFGLGDLGPLVALGMQVGGIGKPDYSGTEAAVTAARNGLALADYRTAGNYFRYNPMDVWAAMNRQDANTRATERALTNSSMPVSNRAAGLLANNYQGIIGDGELYNKGWLANADQEAKKAQYDTTVDQFNAGAFNQTSATNAQLLNNRRQFIAQLMMQKAREDAESRAAWYNGIYGNVDNAFKNLSAHEKENRQGDMIATMANIGIFGPIRDDIPNFESSGWRYVNSTSDGGKINKRKRRKGGLTI